MTKKERVKKSLINFQRPSFIVTENQRVDHLFELWKNEHPNVAWESYINHVYRVLNLARGFLKAKDLLSFEKLSIVAAFHDRDLFAHQNFNYLKQSNADLVSYLESQGMSAWTNELSFILLNHHRLTAIDGNPLAEIFRRADLTDLSFGLFRHGSSPDFYDALKITFPSLNFRRNLVKKSLKYGLTHPWNPLPMMKW